ncbi:MAG: hypothetical protein RMJ98_07420 [Myxococcales bacterium]|nr:hypothetical protein [Polyangiaceae bacterium]MDW8249114.1 hypothetical protein [Myxococcales bacterium]
MCLLSPLWLAGLFLAAGCTSFSGVDVPETSSVGSNSGGEGLGGQEGGLSGGSSSSTGGSGGSKAGGTSGESGGASGSGPPSTCKNSPDCEDDDPCTQEECVEGMCQFKARPLGAPCDDRDKCTESDRCNASGKCVGTPKVVDDGNPCTNDSCDPATGNAVYTPAPGQSCSDGNACTLGDQCNESGSCTGKPKAVDDGNPCTTDTCDPVTGNVAYTPAPNCQPCTNNGDCNDNNPCTNDICQAGKCNYTNVAAGTSCSDNNPCTDNDKCNASGQCAGTPKLCNTPPNACHQSTGFCNQATGNCSYPLLPNGTICSDENECTINDTCQNGSCTSGPPKICNSGGECYQPNGTCNPASGICQYPFNNGASCDDGLFCTYDDTCFNGVCEGIPQEYCWDP